MTYIDFVSKLSPIEEEVMKSSFYEVSERIVNFAETQFFVFWFFFFIDLFTDWLIFGCAGSSFLCEGPLQPRQAGATPHRSARASHYYGLPRCGAQAPDAQAQ